jgi:hypothetical protein
MVALMGAMAAGPSNCGLRRDGKICTAQGGECRYNPKFYTVGMHDARSWQQPVADETCPDQCCYLRDDPRDLGTEEERRGRVNDMIDALGHKQESDTLRGMLACIMLGINPPD